MSHRVGLFSHSVRGTLAAAAFMLCMVSPAAAQEAVRIGYKWTVGETIRQRVTSEMKSKTSNAAGENSQKQVMDLRMTVKSVDDTGTAEIEVVHESLKIDNQASGKAKVSFDSAKPGEGNPDPSTRAMAVMLDVPLTVVIAANGEVKEVRGSDKLMEKFRATFKDAPGADRLLAGLANSFGPEGMKRSWSEQTPMLPNRDVKVGESWPRTIISVVPSLGTLTSSVTSKLVGIQPLHGVPAAKVESVSVIAHTPPKPEDRGSSPAGAMNPTVRDAAGSGELWFDFNKGRLLMHSTTQSMVIDLSMSIGGREMKVTQKVMSTTTFELLDSAPTAPAAEPDAATKPEAAPAPALAK